MNRRELFQSFAALGITATPLTTRDAENVELLVLTCPSPLSDTQVQQIQKRFPEVLKGTAFAKARVIVLSHGMTLEAIRYQQVTEKMLDIP